MIDDREKEEANDRENEGNADASITDVTGIPVEALDQRLENFVQHGRLMMMQEEKIEIDLKKVPKRKKFDKFDKAKGEKEKFKTDYEPPPDNRQLAHTARLPLLAPSDGAATETTAVMRESNRPTPMRPPAEPEVETQETTVPMVMGRAVSEAVPRSDRLTPSLPPPKSVYKQTLLGVAPEANHEERRKSEAGTETPETKGNTARMPAVVPGCDYPTPPSLPADPDKITSPETPASKRAKMQPVAIPINPRPVLTRKPPVKEAVKAERVVSSARKWGVYAGIAVAAVAVVGLVGAVVVMSKGEDKKDASADASVASVVPVAISPPPPSATSPPVVEVAESDASDVASHHDASSVAPATPVPTLTSTRKPTVREKGHRTGAVKPTTPIPVAPSPTRHEPEKLRPTHEDPDTVL
ncbi:MAG: hypothetical protein FWD69_00545 [Polyangiaceae bacterium]|nr:hypothetical protein [Polyangiaceae bacterium]